MIRSGPVRRRDREGGIHFPSRPTRISEEAELQ